MVIISVLEIGSIVIMLIVLLEYIVYFHSCIILCSGVVCFIIVVLSIKCSMH